MIAMLLILRIRNRNKCLAPNINLVNETGINAAASSNVCNTTACQHRAKLITKLLNDDVDPCTDFYGYVCNNWMFHNPIPDVKNVIGGLHSLDDQVLIDLKDILENATYKTKDQNVTDKVAVAYRNCVNTSIPAEVQFRALQDVLKRVVGEHWPISPLFENENTFPSWHDLYIRIHNELNLYYLFAEFVIKDVTNTTKNILVLGMPELDNAVTQTMRVSEGSHLTPMGIATKRVMEFSMKILYPGITDAQTEATIQDIIWFSENITKIREHAESMSEPEIPFVKTTIAQLTSVSKELDWELFFGKILEPVGIKLQPEEPIILAGELYVRTIIEFVSKSRRSTVYNSLMLAVIQKLAPLALPEFQEMLFDVRSITTGAKEDDPQWMRCMNNIVGLSGVMDHPAGRLYIEKKFSTFARKDAKGLVTELIDSFKERLLKIRWMDHKTKLEALTKLTQIVKKVGYADWLMNDTYLNNMYREVEPVVLGQPFILSYLDFRKKSGLEILRKLRVENNRAEVWESGPATGNAFYSPLSNSVIIPAGILQPPLFEYGLPMHINIGAVGTVIGHEVTHAFDETSSLFDAEGNIRNWWTNATKETFLQKVKCFEEQYGSVADKRVHLKLNGLLTKNENIADNGGLLLAYRAYRRWASKTKYEKVPSLPGLNLTSDQLFFTSYAMIWCTNIRPESLMIQIHTDSHSPERHRVNEVLKNTKEFSEAFSCSETSRMNNKDKCIVW
ncbi:neprilysin-1-like [Ixodes scapularis]|uniref:neprilysin-1-like n=1 Tax=Ixodes scapularis TaxID=6945 RepID=UPI001A9F9F48|nr:neprilysin-1-like [Ixodes scapularis]